MPIGNPTTDASLLISGEVPVARIPAAVALDAEAVLQSLLTTQGDIAVRGVAAAERLAKITTGQFLKATATGYEGGVPTGASLTVAETEVFNGTSPLNWTDLDLSGTIGENATLVLLKIGTPSVSQTVTGAFRPDGDTNEYYAGTTKGSHVFSSVGADAASLVVLCTSSAGIVEWRTVQAKAGTMVSILAYGHA